MTNISSRSFSCKNEELPVIAGFSAISLERDLADFTAYSPIFDAAYLNEYKSKIETVQELVLPYAETVEGKLITEHIEATLQLLITFINHLKGYVNLASGSIPMNPADFGLLQLRKSVRKRDLEAVLNLIRPVENNMQKYKTELSVKGMTEAFVTKFKQAGVSLGEDKNKRYVMVSTRAAMMQNNMTLLNDLHAQMTEVCNIGKILYKTTDKAKLKDYTISSLLKQVHRTTKPSDSGPKPNTKNQAGVTEPEKE